MVFIVEGVCNAPKRAQNKYEFANRFISSILLRRVDSGKKADKTNIFRKNTCKYESIPTFAPEKSSSDGIFSAFIATNQL